MRIAFEISASIYAIRRLISIDDILKQTESMVIERKIPQCLEESFNFIHFDSLLKNLVFIAEHNEVFVQN